MAFSETSRMIKWLVIVGCGLAAVGCKRAQPESSERSDAYVEFAMEDQSLSDSYRLIVTRSDAAAPGAFLMALYEPDSLAQTNMPPASPEVSRGWPRSVYRYCPASRTVERVPAEAWFASTSPVHAYPNTTKLMSMRIRDGSFGDQRRTAATEGSSAVVYQENPDGSFIAVISADGRNTGVSIPLFAGSRAYSGQHHHEVFRWSDLEPVGLPIPIPLKSSADAIIMAWSPDSRYVIYRYRDRPDAVIVPVLEQQAGAP
jgi:hypothetical protein